jgi:hypothetical protein
VGASGWKRRPGSRRAATARAGQPRLTADTVESPPGLGIVRTRTVPVFTVIRLMKEEPDSVPAASPRLPRSTSPWSPGRSSKPTREFPTPNETGWGAPLSAHIRQVGADPDLRDVNAGSLRTPFHPARRTRTIWQCWRVPTLSGPLATLTVITRIGLPPAPPSCCDRIGGGGLPPPLESTAPHGALNGN